MITIKMIVNIIKYSLITIVASFTTIIVLSSLLLFTHSGNQFIIKIVQRFESRLSIELIEGSFLNAPKYKNISWIDGEIAINIAQLNYQFEWSCLTKKLCLESLNIDGATISLPEATAQHDEKAEVSSIPLIIDIPIEIGIQNVSLSAIRFTLGQLQVDLDTLLLAADVSGNNVSLTSQINGLIVTLPDSEAERIQQTKTATSSHKKRMDLSLSSIPAILTNEMLPTVKLPINLKIKAIVVERFTLIQNQQTLFSLNTLNSAFVFEESKLVIRHFELDIPETDVNLKGEINFIEDYPLSLTISGQVKKIKQLTAENQLNGLHYSLKSSGSLSDLNSELVLSKKINLQLTTHLNLFADNLPHRIELNWKNLTWPLNGEIQYQSEQGSFTSKGSLLDHQISMQSDYKLTGLPSGKVSLETKGDLQHLQIESLNIETLSGEIDFAGMLTWQDKIDWLGQLKITNIDLKELNSDYDGQFSGVLKQQVSIDLFENSTPEWRFDFPELNIDGTLLKRPLTLSGRISGNDKQGITFDKLTINNAQNTMIVNGVLAEQNDLTVALNIVDLSHALKTMKGKINANIHLTGPQHALQVETQLKAEKLAYQHYQLQVLDLNGHVILTKKPQLSLAVNAKNLVIDKQVIDNINLKIENKALKQQNFKHQIKLLLNSELLTTELKLYLTQTDNVLLAELNQAKLYLAHQTLTLSKPFHITQKDKNIRLSAHCWQAKTKGKGEESEYKAGKLCINEFNVGDSGKVVFNINKYLLANFNPFFPDTFKMAGALSANAEFEWQKDNKPNFKAEIFSDDMLLKINSDPQKYSVNDYPMKSFHIDINGSNKGVLVDAKIFAEQLINIKVKGRLQPYLNEPKIDALVDIQLPNFSLLLPIIPQLENLQGELNSHLTMSGKLKNPIINGDITIKDGHISSATLPVQITKLQTAIKIYNTQATIIGSFDSRDKSTIGEYDADIPLLTSTLNIFDRALKKISEKLINFDQKTETKQEKKESMPGIVFIKGQFDWSNKLKGNLHFYAHKLEIYDYGKIDLLVSPDIQLQVDDKITVSGELFIDKGKVVVEELPAGAILQSKDIVVIDIEKENVAPDLPVIIDLTVDMGKDFQLVALGLDSFINGNLLIKKALMKDLTINGELNFVDGSYRSLGQQLVLQKSRVVFQGAPESPYLSIEAIRDTSKIEDNVIAGVRVTGTPDELTLVIFSEPAMAQQEALSYLTRGQSLDSSSDNSTMANILIDIAAGQSGGLMSTIGEGVGIKDLSISSSGTGDEQSVGVRGEIAPGVELSYGVGVFDSFTIFALRYEIFERFYIEASSSINQAVDAYYEWDWD